MFSLNVPVPPAVDRLAADLHPRLTPFDTVREGHTLVCKRFGVDDVPSGGRAGSPTPVREKQQILSELREDLRPLLAGTDPLACRITGIDAFEDPAQGPGPVVYLVVDSPDLERVHARLCGAFDPVPGIEGDDYVPHVTLARGGSIDDLESVSDAAIDPIEWTARALELYDPDFRETAATIPL